MKTIREILEILFDLFLCLVVIVLGIIAAIMLVLFSIPLSVALLIVCIGYLLYGKYKDD